MSNIANPTPTTKPWITPRSNVAKNTTIHINCALIEVHNLVVKWSEVILAYHIW